MAAADVIVCRAGATTLAEVTAAGRAAVLIPQPTATDDHQRHNAGALVRLGAAEMIEQRELSGTRLADVVLALLGDDERRLGMAARARAAARPDAARLIVDRLWALATGTRLQGEGEQVLGRTRHIHLVGVGGIGIVRLSGPQARQVFGRIFRRRGAEGPLVSHRFYLGEILLPQDPAGGGVIDERRFQTATLARSCSINCDM